MKTGSFLELSRKDLAIETGWHGVESMFGMISEKIRKWIERSGGIVVE